MLDHAEQAVIVRAALPSISDDIWTSLGILEDELAIALAQENVGELDGNEIGQSELVIYMYGADADNLFNVIAPVLQRSHLTSSASVSIRYGGPGANSRFVNLEGSNASRIRKI
jgi:hypothetical protein